MNKISLLIVAVGLVFTSSASATLYTYNFGTNVTNNTGYDVVDFATLTIDSVTDTFTLSTKNLDTLFSTTGAFVSDLFVGYSGVTSPAPGVDSFLGPVGSVNSSGSGQLHGFDFRYDFPTANHPAGNRFEQNETVSWVSSDFNFNELSSATQYNSLFGVHVQGLLSPTGAATSDIFITSVPEPETYAMMLAGLGLIGFISSRRKNS